MGSVLKVGLGSITFEGSVPWEEKWSGKGEGSTIPEGSERGVFSSGGSSNNGGL